MARSYQNQTDNEFQVTSKLFEDVVENGLERDLSPLEIKLAETKNCFENSPHSMLAENL